MRISALAYTLLATLLAAGSGAACAADAPAPAAPADAAAAPAAPPAPAAAPADDAPPPAAAKEQAPNEQVIQPELDRRKVKLPRIPSSDFELGAFTGTYATENFGSSLVYGVRLGYHVTEDFFTEAVYGQTRVSDQTYRQILPGGIFPTPKETLRYYDLSAGYNVFAGELFLGRRTAKVSTVYLIAGVGSTQFLNARHLTVNGGVGMRVFMADWAALQVDARDHVFSVDLLGSRKNTQNLEFSGGLTFFF